MRISAVVQKIVQGLSIASALGTQFGPAFTNPQTKKSIVVASAAIAALAGVLGQYSNPDGTPAEEPWEPKQDLGKLGDFKEPKL